jgi:ribose/xylose/arabinose/galactoside ABC-type transport system permease subunit
MNSPNQTQPNTGLSKSSIAFGLSLAITSVASALLVVAKELSPKLVMVGMKRLTGHHWVTHSLLAVVLFVVLGFAFSLANGGQGMKTSPGRLIATLAGGVIVGGFIIAGFYLLGG